MFAFSIKDQCHAALEFGKLGILDGSIIKILRLLISICIHDALKGKPYKKITRFWIKAYVYTLKYSTTRILQYKFKNISDSALRFIFNILFIQSICMGLVVTQSIYCVSCLHHVSHCQQPLSIFKQLCELNVNGSKAIDHTATHLNNNLVDWKTFRWRVKSEGW